MNLISIIAHNIFAFVIILSLIVFVHEFGHYYIAKLCGVKVEEFSIGFGKELFGINDKSGTRWKFSIMPFGGYVKMFGDKNPASIADQKTIKEFSDQEKKIAFYCQNVYKRIAIVFAGPAANFIFTIIIFTILFKVQGMSIILPVVDQTMENSAAAKAGIISGDLITKIDDVKITDFEQMHKMVIENGNKSLRLEIKRGEKIILFNITPQISASKDFFGNEIKLPLLGISASQIQYHKLNLGAAFLHANYETYQMSVSIFKAVGQLITGKKSIKELGGPVKIAEYSGQSMSMGLMVVLWFMAMISVNLGAMNLLPLPVLDGGHLFYYLIEIIMGRPLPEKVQSLGFQFGFAVLIALMIFTTYNDVTSLFK